MGVVAICVMADVAHGAVTAEELNRAALECVSTRLRYYQAYAEELHAGRMVFQYREAERAAFARGIPFLYSGDFRAAEPHFREARMNAALAAEWTEKQVTARAIATERFYSWYWALERYRLILNEFHAQGR